MTTMTIGVDLHKRQSQLCFLAPDGTTTERRIVTSPERFTALFGHRATSARAPRGEHGERVRRSATR